MAERTLTVKILGDERSLQRAFATSTRASKQFTGTIREQAAASIVARVQERRALEKLAAEYTLVAERATQGSAAQLAAARLARDAQSRLAASFGVVSRESGHARGNVAGLEHDLTAASRGALAGSGIFRSLGRSIVFASGGFLAFGGAAAFLRKSVDAAREAQIAQRQLATQLTNSGKSYADYREQINSTILRVSALAGIENDELIGGLTTILRTTPNVGKALRDIGTAADLARAKHISLAAAATIIAKTEAGNTTLLRRQGIQIAKNATSEQALAKLRQVVAGQARAGTTEQERFGAVLHDTEEIIGTGVLPTLNKYLVSGTRWLQQMNESGKLQKNVATAAHDFESAISAVSTTVKAVDRVTGSFKNTLELLLALKLASWASAGVGSVVRLGGSFSRTNIAAKELTAGEAALAAQAGVASFALTTLSLKATGLDTQLKKAGGSARDLLSKIPGFDRSRFAGPSFTSSGGVGDKPGQVGGIDVKKVELAAHTMLDAGQTADRIMASLARRFTSLTSDDLTVLLRIAQKTREAYTAAGGAAAEASAKAAHGLAAAKQFGEALTGGDTTSRGLNLTATQRNTFFDNAITRLLQRGGLGDLQQQLSAIEKAKGLLEKRLAGTKDITRRLNLEDQILQLAAQAKGIRTQISEAALQRRQKTFDALIASLQLGVTEAQAKAGLGNDIRALEKLQAGIKAEIKALGDTTELQGQLFDVTQQIKEAKKARISAAEFFTLGLDATGGDRVPTVANLKKRLGTIQDAVSGTVLDTKQMQTQLARIRKVLSESIVPSDVRAKLKQLLDDIRSELNKGISTRDQTKFKHASTAALLAGLGLTPEQIRAVRERLAQVGAGGSVPGGSSQSFSLAGGQGGVTVNGDINLHGIQDVPKLAAALKKHSKQRSRSRRG